MLCIMSLFPAYASSETDKEGLKSTSSLDWLKNESCPAEVGTLQHTTLNAKLSPKCVSSDIDSSQICNSSAIPYVDKEEHSVNSSTNTSSPQNVSKKIKKKKKKKDELIDITINKSKKKSKKKRRKRKRHSSQHSSSRSRSVSQSRSRSNSRSLSNSYSKSPSRSGSRSRSGSVSKHYRKKKKHRGKRKSYSCSRSRSVSPKYKTKHYSRSRSRSMSHKSKSRSRSRSRLNESHRMESISSKYLKKEGKKSLRIDEQSYVNKDVVSGSSSVFLNDIIGSVKPMEAFYLDTKPDKNNLAFNVTHYTQLARYRTITKRIFGDKTKRKNNLKTSVRYFQRKSKKYLYCDSTLIASKMKSAIEQAAIKGNDCYIPLGLTYSESSTSLGANLSNNERNLSIDDYTKLEEQDQEQTEQTSDELVYKYWHDQLKTYNQQLRMEPSNVDLWLKFVRIQDRLFIYLFPKENKGERAESKNKLNLKALAERKISILDSAIKKNSNSLELQFERLEIGEEIWDEQKLKNEWSILVFNNSDSMNVWCHYLAFVQTYFSIFSLPFVVKSFEKCLEKLQSIRDGSFLGHTPYNMNRCLVDIAFQLAHVWQKAGYRERGIALFQALCEFNLYAPQNTKRLSKSLQDQLMLFEPFWDSRAKRFGEKGALGWDTVMKNKNPVVFPEVIIGETHDEEDDIISSGGKASELWAALELSREKQHWMPWEKDPEDCEDPERMVSLDEILPHLFTLDESQDKLYLVLQFLSLITGLTGLECCHNIAEDQPSRLENRNSSTKYDDIFKPMRLESFHDLTLMENDLDIIRSRKRNFMKLGLVGQSLFDISSDMYFDFACNIIQQSFSVFKMPDKKYLAIAYIKILTARYQGLSKEELSEKELKLLKKTSKKQVKNLLKIEEFRTCLQLYLEYGHLESTMGQIEEAEKVYSTALSLGTQTNNIFNLDNPDIIVLLNLLTAYIHLQVQQEICIKGGHQYNKVLNTICMVTIEGKFNPSESITVPSASILKARKKLQELVNSIINFFVVNDEAVSVKYKQELLLGELVMCLALIQLVTVGLKSACLVYESTIASIRNATDIKEINLPYENKINWKDNSSEKKNTLKNNKCLEKLSEDYAWFAEATYELRHLTVNMEVLSPAEFRTQIKSALDIAPGNVNLLQLFTNKQGWRDVVFGSELNVQNIQRYSIESLLLQLLPQIRSIIHLFNSTTEGSLSSGCRLENLLELAVSCPPGRNCPLLWRLYLQLVQATRPKAVRPLLYRAITNCPAAKSLYIDAISCDGGLLREMCKLMGEKGVRVRMPLEELQVLTECDLDEDKPSGDSDEDQQLE